MSKENIFTKIKAGWNVLKAGEMVANPIAWKKGQISTGHLVAVLSSIVVLSKSLGYELPLDDTQQAALATVILWAFSLFNQYATVASTDKLGFGLKDGESVVETSSTTAGEGSNSSRQLGRYPPNPDTEILQDADSRYQERQRERDSSIG